jgi:hypothetical protein
MCVIARERQGNRLVRGVVGHHERGVAVCKGGWSPSCARW